MRLKPGDRCLINVPYSEVCMHMKVAGTNMIAQIMPGSPGRYAPYVRLEKLNDPSWRSTVSLGEGGFTDQDCEDGEVRPMWGTLVSEHGPDFYSRSEAEAAIHQIRASITGVPA